MQRKFKQVAAPAAGIEKSESQGFLVDGVSWISELRGCISTEVFKDKLKTCKNATDGEGKMG